MNMKLEMLIDECAPEVNKRTLEILKTMRDRPELSVKMSIDVATELEDFQELAALYMALYIKELNQQMNDDSK